MEQANALLAPVRKAGGIVTQLDGTPIDLSAPCSVFAGNANTYPALMKPASPYGH